MAFEVIYDEADKAVEYIKILISIEILSKFKKLTTVIVDYNSSNV